MLYYYNPLIEDGIFYSCDSLRFSFVFPDADTVEDFLTFLSRLPGSTHYQSLKDFDYRYLRFLYKGIIIKHNKTEPTYTKTSLFLCEKRRFFMGRTEKGGKVF